MRGNVIAVTLLVGFLTAFAGTDMAFAERELTAAQKLVLARDMQECRLPKGAQRETIVYTVFLSRGYAGPGSGVEEELFTSNQELLRKLEAECPGVKFVVRDVTTGKVSAESIRDELGQRKKELDGVILIGIGSGGGPSRDYSLAFSGLPTLAVYNLFEFMNFPYKLLERGTVEEPVLVGETDYQKPPRILTAELDRRSLCKPEITAAMFRDLVYKIKLLQAIKHLKESRILVVTPLEFIAQVDYQGDINRRMPENYNEMYSRALEASLGIELVMVSPEEFFEAYDKADEQRAEEVSQEWIENARRVDAGRSEITRTARAYLAFEALREKYDCNAVSTFMRRLKPNRRREDQFWPGLGLECGFKMEGIQAVCQNYPNILVTELLGYFLTGRPSMLGDLIVDPANGTTILTHCGAPVNPYGDDRIVPYDIKTHAQSPVRNTQKPGSSTGLQVEWPAGEPMTVWKMYVLHKKIGLYTGQVENARSVYDQDRIDAILCRTKLVTRVDNPGKIQSYFSPDEYGIHRAATLGDLREVIKDVSVLLGYSVMEEDR